MEKDQGCCEKFFSTTPRTASNPKNREAVEAVPVEFDYTGKSQKKDGKQHQIASGKSVPKRVNVQSEQGKFPKNEQHQGSQETAGKNTLQHIEDKFTDYINRAKIKIRTMSNVGEGKSSSVEKNNHGGKEKTHHGGKESKEHHFLDYIKRAGLKIRKTSSIKDRSE